VAANNVVPNCCPQCGGPLPPDSGEHLVCEYCGSSLIRLSPQSRADEQAWGVRLRRVSCTDDQGAGGEAFSLLIPADWTFQGGVQWLMNNPGLPAVIAFRAQNPHGAEAFEAFPNLPFYWTNNPMLTMTFPVGSVYYGNEVRPPGPAVQVLREIVIPRYRGQVPQLQMVDQEHLPSLATEMQASSPVAPTNLTSADGARVRIQYHQGDRTVEEDVYGVVEVSQQPGPMMMGMQHIFWMADYLFSFRALAGHLDRLSDVFTSMVRSFRLNPGWYSRYSQVSQTMIQNQIQQIHHVGQISRMISQTNDQISDMVMASYDERQRTLNRLSNQFSQAIRGVDAYHDPRGGRNVDLPGGYRQAWANGLGEYIVTDDATFNPNVGTTQNWEPLERR